MIGWSGPCYPDQKELTWEQVGQSPEMTSVSKKVRRVFTFSEQQYMESCQMNGCTDVFMNFMNYLPNHEKQEEFFKRISSIGPRISWCGYGPTINDIASVKLVKPSDGIDNREGCHPTMFSLDKFNGEV